MIDEAWARLAAEREALPASSMPHGEKLESASAAR
jgi:hypothetical protein